MEGGEEQFELYHFTSVENAAKIVESGEIIGGGNGLWRWGAKSANDVYFAANKNVNGFVRTFIYGLSPSKQRAVITVKVIANRVIKRPFGIRIVPGPVSIH